MVFISFVDLKLVEDINPSKFGGLHGVEPFWNIKQGGDGAGADTVKLQTASIRKHIKYSSLWEICPFSI